LPPSGLLAIRVVGTMGVFFQVPGVLAHNWLDWLFFFRDGSLFSVAASPVATLLLLIGSVVLLMILDRVIVSSHQQHELARRGADRHEQHAMMWGQVMTSALVASLSLLLALVVVFTGAVVGAQEWLFNDLPWPVFTVGLGASVLAAAIRVSWLRSLRSD
jgi:hypothetical protein